VQALAPKWMSDVPFTLPQACACFLQLLNTIIVHVRVLITVVCHSVAARQIGMLGVERKITEPIKVGSYDLKFGQSQTDVGVIIENTAYRLVALTVVQ